MKAEIIKDVDFEEEIKFPILMEFISNGEIVLFYDEKSGICIYGTSKDRIYNNLISCNDRSYWKPFNGIIQLQND